MGKRERIESTLYYETTDLSVQGYMIKNTEQPSTRVNVYNTRHDDSSSIVGQTDIELCRGNGRTKTFLKKSQ